MIPIFLFVVGAVFIPIFIAIFPHVMAIPVVPVAISIPIAGPSIIAGAAVIRVMIIPLVSYDAIIAEARIISEARFVLASPFPIFPLALTAQPVVLDIVISALSQPLPVVRIVVSVVAAGAVIRIISPISVLRAPRCQNRSRGQS